MNEEIYQSLKAYKPHLEGWCTKQDSIRNDVLRAINHLYQVIFPTAKPVNMSCYGCVNDMMHTMLNVLRQYENAKGN